MKTKNSSSRPKNHTPGEVRYCNYFVTFPDGEEWSEYVHIVGELDSWITRTALHKINPDAARKLKQKGEYHWYVTHPRGKVRHRMVLSETACERKWGLGKKLRTSAAIEIMQ